MEYVTLNNGIKMPKLGYGVYQTAPEDTKRCVLDAIETGYRSIDTAQAYQNESGVGDALAECGLPREEFFLTTKVWITNAGYEKAKASIEESLKKTAYRLSGSAFDPSAVRRLLWNLSCNGRIL